MHIRQPAGLPSAVRVVNPASAAVDGHRATDGFDESGEQFQQRAFARASGADDGDLVAFADVAIDIGENGSVERRVRVSHAGGMQPFEYAITRFVTTRPTTCGPSAVTQSDVTRFATRFVAFKRRTAAFTGGNHLANLAHIGGERHDLADDADDAGEWRDECGRQ